MMIPLSFAQQRLWFLHQLDPSPVHNIVLTLRLRGPLSRTAFRDALCDVVDRHEVLRTVFPADGGQPVQRILTGADAGARLAWQEVDCPAGLAAAELAGRAEHVFDLGTELPFRAALLTCGPEDHRFSLIMHHIVADGWSLDPLLADLTTAYAARCAGLAPDWAPLPVQYADYAMWQRDLLGSQADPGSVVNQQLGYWTKTLDGLPAEVTLPLRRPRPTEPDHQGDLASVVTEAALHRALAGLAAAEHATLFMVLQTALAVLLTRLGAGTDIPLGTPVAGRTDESLEDLVGFFVNTLVLRTDTSGNPTFRELLARVRETDLAAYAHQDLPFERIVEELNPERSLARHPLFQVMLVLQSQAAQTVGERDLGTRRAGALEIDLVPELTTTAKFDLSAAFSEIRTSSGEAAGIIVSFEYATELFSRAEVDGFLTRLVRLLEAMTADPGTRIATVEIVTEAERELLTGANGFNDTDRPTPPATLADLVSRSVDLAPDALAVVAEDRTLTYAQLDAAARYWAGRLAGHGIGPEDLVALAIPRGADLLVGMLAVVYSGAAYLPLDPDYPPERVEFMVRDAAPAAVLAAASVLSSFAVPSGCPVLLIDGPCPAGGAAVDRDAPVAVPRPPAPENPVYVMYTSGSTGRPKGVVITHAAVAGYLRWRYRLTAADRVLVKTPSSFDASVLEVFWTLVCGAAMVVARPGGHRDTAYLAELIRRERVTTVEIVPALLAALLDEPDLAGCVSLRRVVSGGEDLSAALRDRFASVLPGVALFNSYGPTEATVDVTWYPCVPGEPTVPIGALAANARAYVLDEALQLVPPGQAGELYLAGAQLARGYLGRPGLTATRFVANPFDRSGSRLYRTGDLARWRADGVLEYLGRGDRQVKIRGVRIEPGEIEAVLAGHPAVAQPVVLIRPDQAGAPRLVAFVIPVDPHAGATAGSLREWLVAKLPPQYVPDKFVFLEDFPLSPSGKVNRSALALPETALPVTAARPGRAPRTPREEILCGLFAELLHVPEVAADDSFFALGGHSLLAVRLINRAREALGTELDVRDVFRTPTPAGLAGKLDRPDPHGRARPPLAALADRPDRIPLSHAQRRMWFLHQLEPSGAYTMATALRLRGEWQPTALRMALDDVVDRHEALRTVYPEVDGEPVQRIMAGARPPWTLTRVTEADLAEAIERVSTHVFDLAAEIPVRADVLELSAADHVLVLVLHHIAGDGWSMGPLLTDLAAAYTTRMDGRPPDWAPLPAQYADYALWQRELLGTQDDPDSLLSEQLGYWRTQLAGLPDQIALPTDRPHPAQPSHRGETWYAEIPEPVHAAVVELARAHQVTVYMVLQAALATLLHRMGAGTDIPLGSVVAGRTDAATDDLVGFFVNTLVLRTDLSGDPTFAELLGRVRETDLSALSAQEVPFDQLVEISRPTRSLARHPLFQVMLVLQNLGDAALVLPGLETSFEPVGTATAKFDLTLIVSEATGAGGVPGGMRVAFEYATDLFDRATIEAFAERLTRVLATVTAGSVVRVGSIDMLRDDERDAVLRAWQGPAVPTDWFVPDGGPVPSGRCVPELIAWQARRNPGALAVTAEDGAVSYGELDARADRVARELTDGGVLPGTLVGVCLERGTAMVAAMLGILRAGAAYVPVDPNYPPPRRTFLIEDTAMPVIVTRSGLAHLLPSARPPAPPAGRIKINPDTPAYVVHTSGSTGTPKGVVVNHRSLTDMCLEHAWRYGIMPEDRASQIAAQGFDAAVAEIWPYLCAGASVHLPSQRVLDDTQALLDWIAAMRLTCCFLPTPRLELLLDELAATRTSLRWLFTAGDVLRRRPRSGLGFTLLNLYGPTEFTVVATGGPVTPDGLQGTGGQGLPHIGRPVGNARAYVLDGRLAPVPPGVPGELYLAGPGVARGYLNRPGLTAARFVPDPFSAEPGARMYATGDVVRWLPTGDLAFLGRSDGQVKVSGVRIEPAEIEAALARLPTVREVAVAAVADPDGHKRLVAYVVTGADGISGDQLRRQAAGLIPDYLVPAMFVRLDGLPLTPNGKIDRSALPVPSAWSGARPAGRAGGRGRAPRTSAEQRLTEIFTDVLGLTGPVFADDSFFDLGGHSLLAARLISRLRRELDADVSIRTLFTAPTPELLAEQLTSQTASDGLDVLIPLRGGGATATSGTEPLFCIHPAAGLSWPYAGLLRYLEPDRPVFGLQSRLFTSPGTGEPDIDGIVTDYLTQIRSAQPHGPYHLLGWSFGGNVAHAIAARLQAEGDEVALLALLDAYPVTPTPAADALAADDPRLLADLLTSLGLPAPAAATRDDLVRLAVPEDSPLHGFPPAGLAALPDVFAANGNALLRHRTGCVDGDLLFFAATADDHPGDPAAWRDHVSGAIEIHQIPARHGDMLRTDPLAKIGPILAAYLAKLANLTNRI
jgi:amino acid adenylation domain-containing protein